MPGSAFVLFVAIASFIFLLQTPDNTSSKDVLRPTCLSLDLELFRFPSKFV